MAFSLEKREQNAHEEAMWAADWYVPGTDIMDGKIITGGLDDAVKMWRYDGNDLFVEKTLLGHSLGVVSVKVDPSGTMIASASLDANISVWDFETGEKKRNIDTGGPLESWTVEFSRDSKYLLSGAADGKVEMFNVETGQKEKSLETKGKMALSLATSPDGKWIACGGSNGLVAMLEATTQTYFKTLEGHAMPVRALAFSPDSKLLLTASDDKHVKIYALTEFQVVGTMSGHSSWVLGVSVSPDGSNFATCSSDRSVRVWDMTTRSCSHVYNEAHTDQIWSIVWGSNTKLASVGEDKCLNIYNMLK